MERLLRFYNQFGLLGVIGVVSLAETGLLFFIPDEGLLVYLGFHTRLGSQSFLWSVISVTLSVVVGSSLLYWLVRLKGAPLLARYGRFIGVDQQRLERAEQLLRRWGNWAVVIGRLTPGMRLAVTITAALLGFPYLRFVANLLVAVPLWAAFYMGLGYYLGAQALKSASLLQQALVLIKGHEPLLLLLLLTAVALVIVWRRWSGQLKSALLGLFSLRAKRVNQITKQSVAHVADRD